ncbi:hypothetical protein BEH94_05425 [Candidatus Altiarchaeales archaeon WOR_SM1_SCG]|nr:hypothetical protein BEH94_05425 [Candidatus Altiarchaeales archaeon WOR_SM1_SCG]
MYVLIVGGGVMGRELAKALAGNDIVIIEKNIEKSELSEHEIDGMIIKGDATRMDILEQAGIDDADIILAITGNDEVNLMVAMLGKKKGKKVIARVNTPDNIKLFKQSGIDNALTPERKAALSIAVDIQKMVESEKVHLLIAGGGTMGRELANALVGQSAIIIEKDPAKCEKAIRETSKLVIQGDATQLDLLERAGIDQSDIVAAMTDSDEVNLLVATLAKQKGKKVIVRVKDAEHGRLFKELGIDYTVTPECRAAEEIAKEILKGD